jgi:cell division protein FtsL
VSGPARPVAPGRAAPPARRAGEQSTGLVLGALDLLRGISSHRLLDRLIRGRAWIALVAFALLGIVTLQLALLKLNTSVGRSLERGAVLQRENAALSIENSELAAGGRVESTAARLGMSLVPAGTLKFLTARPRQDPAFAVTALNAPVHAITGSEEAAAAAAQAESASAAGEEASATSASETSSAAATSSASGESSGASGESSAASGESSGAGGGEERSSSAATSGAAPSSGGGEAGAGGGTQASPTG